LDALAGRRRDLVARSDENRVAIAAVTSHLERRLAVAEVVVNVARRLHRHRFLIGAVAVFLLATPGGARKWIRRATGFLPLVMEGFRLFRSRNESRDASPVDDDTPLDMA
jgi:hypothetical protein